MSFKGLSLLHIFQLMEAMVNGENGLIAMEDVLLQILLLKGQGHVIHLQLTLEESTVVHLLKYRNLITVSI